MIDFGPWLPDQPPYRMEASLVDAHCVYPRPDGSYAPLTATSAITNALPDRALGLFSYRTLDGTYGMFAATATHLYQLQSDGDWLQVSKSGGYSLDVGEGERPSFTQFGNYVVVAMGIGDPTQVFNIDGGSQFGDLSADAPRANHAATVRDFVMLASTFDGSQGVRPDQVWWSAIGNHAGWPAPGTAAAAAVQSDRQVLPDSGHIVGIVPKVGGRDAAIFCQSAIWTMAYEGAPTVFRFDPVQGAKGCYAGGSIVPLNGVVYYLAADGFYVFDGAQSVPIGRGKVDRWFLADLDDSFRDFIFGAYDTETGLVMWSYPGSGHSSGVPNKLLMYEPSTGRFTRAPLGADLIATAATVGYSLEGLDSLGYTLDTLPFSLDSRVWKGGSPFVGIIDSTTKRLGTFGTTPLQADLTTNEFSGQYGSRVWIDGLRVYGDPEPVKAAISWRDSRGGSLTDTSYVEQDEDFIDQLVACRFARIKVRVDAGVSWTALQGYDPSMRQEGRR